MLLKEEAGAKSEDVISEKISPHKRLLESTEKMPGRKEEIQESSQQLASHIEGSGLPTTLDIKPER